MNSNKLTKAIAFSLLGIPIILNTIAGYKATAQSNSSAIPEIEWDDAHKCFQFDSDKFIGQRFSFNCSTASYNFRPGTLYGKDF